MVNLAARAAPGEAAVEEVAVVVEEAAEKAPPEVELAPVQESAPHWVMESALARESAV